MEQDAADARVDLEQVASPVTWGLRRRVLRPQAGRDGVAWPGDDDPGATHVAAFDRGSGDVVGVGSLLRQDWPSPWGDAERLTVPATSRAWRLRGMAVEPDRRGQGVGQGLLALLVEQAVLLDAEVLWCAARLPAVSLYRRHGLVVQGPSHDPAHPVEHVLLALDRR